MGKYDEEWVFGLSEGGCSEKKLLEDDDEMSGEVAEEEREGDEVEEEREGEKVEEEEIRKGDEEDEVEEGEEKKEKKKKERKRKRKRHEADVAAADAILSLSNGVKDVAEKKNKKRKKKKKKGGHRDEKKEDESRSSSKKLIGRPFERIWKVEDEHLLFKLMAEYKHNTDKEPAVKNPAFMEFLREKDGLFVNQMSEDQVFNKIRSSKRKLRQYYKNKKNFETEEEELLFQLLNAIWPNCEEEMEKRKKKKSSPLCGAADNRVDHHHSLSLTSLDEWFNEGMRNVECPEKRLQLERDWSKNKARFVKARLRLLQFLTNVFTPSDQ